MRLANPRREGVRDLCWMLRYLGIIDRDLHQTLRDRYKNKYPVEFL